MNDTTQAHCLDTLLDLVWYEIYNGRLSLEMEVLLTQHLADCPECRERFQHFEDVLSQGGIVSGPGSTRVQ